MICLVTTSAYSAEEVFSEADQVVTEFGDSSDAMLTFSEIVQLHANCQGCNAGGTEKKAKV
tara:strand:- start:322 stop:504 length:183 start_codon:yes stop_codon:yes gene_type:complete